MEQTAISAGPTPVYTDSPETFADTTPDAIAPGIEIELVEGYGEWFVRTVCGQYTMALSRFECEGFAIAHAETERSRLGLTGVSKF